MSTENNEPRADPRPDEDVASEAGGSGSQEATRTDRSRRARSIGAGLLIVVLGFSATATAVAMWLHETLLDTETFVETISPVFSDPAITDPLGEFLTEKTFEVLALEERVTAALTTADEFIEQQVREFIDLDPRIEDRLAQIDRPQFADLAGPLVAAAEDAVRAEVQEYLASDAFEARFTGLVTRAHRAAVALLRGEYEDLPKVVVDSDSVSLDLTPAVASIIQRLVEGGVGIIGLEPPSTFTEPVDTPEEARAWLSDTFDREIDPDFATVTVMSGDHLETLQEAVRTFDRLVWLLLIISVALVIAALWITPQKPRGVVQISLAIAIASLLAWLLIDRLKQVVVEAFGDPAGREAARTTLDSVLASLERLWLFLILAALLVGVVAFFLSRDRHRDALRWTSQTIAAEPGSTSVERFVASHYDGMRLAGAAAALILLFVIGIGVVSLVAVGAGLALYLWLLAALEHRAAEPAPGGRQPGSEESLGAPGPSDEGTGV